MNNKFATRRIGYFATTVIILLLLGGVLGLAYLKDDIDSVLENLHVKIVDYHPPAKTVWLPQNVNPDQLRWFYHADQGTRTFGIPYEWFMKLRQPKLLFAGRFSEPAYLARYGFIPDTVFPNKPDALPIGFAHGLAMRDPTGAPFVNPRSKEELTAIGLTCTGCHTGSLTYKDTAIVIDGGSAMVNLFELKKGIGLSLLLTKYWPGRFSQFADDVLGEGSSVADRMTLRQQLDLVLKQYGQVKSLEESVATGSVEEGYARLDALNRIGNQVFSIDLNKPSNYAAHSAPVHFPRIWNAPWFDWVQYNGSIMQPMVRNAGEALGVSADLNLTDPSKGLWKSSARIEELHKIEKLIAGDDGPSENGFSGLRSPEWPQDILGRIDMNLARTGADVYESRCQGCHLPAFGSKALSDEKRFALFTDKKYWTTNDVGQPILKLKQIPIEHIGTDPAQAEDMLNRTVDVPAELGIKHSGFGPALGEVVENTVNAWYKQEKTSWEDQQRLNGYRPNGIRAELKYKARPLNGVWATPPYLHNGSVPTIDALLSPETRPAKFYLGTREYDPNALGYVWKDVVIADGFQLDTGKRGNANTGHEFSKKFDKDKPVKGVIGPELTENERRALIEFLKTF